MEENKKILDEVAVEDTALTEENQETDHESVAVEIKFTVAQTLFAWVSLVVGYLFCRAFPIFDAPLGSFLLLTLLFVITLVVLKKDGICIGRSAVLWFVIGFATALALVLTSNPVLHFVGFFFAVAVYGYAVYSANSNRLQNGLSDLVIADFIRALIIFPLSSLADVFKAMFYGRASSCGKVLLKIIGGVALAVVPTVVVFTLLSYDSGFTAILSDVFDFGVGDVFKHIGSMILGLPVGMYIFGMYVASHKGSDGSGSAERYQKAVERMRFLPIVTSVVAALPLCFIYIVFFISQWQYYVSAFSGVLPEGLSLSEYAREGFFQLCAVSVINLVLVISIGTLMRRSDNKRPLALRIISIVYSVMTLILIATAMSKMVLYIENLGLTRKRVYASWLMVIIAVVFVFIIIKQFVPKFKTVAVSVILVVVAVASLSFFNVDGFIAHYNVDRYLDGSLETVDVWALRELGDAAVPEVVRLAKEMDKRNGTDIEIALQNKDYIYSDKEGGLVYNNTVSVLWFTSKGFYVEHDGVLTYTVQTLRAENALRSIGAIE